MNPVTVLTTAPTRRLTTLAAVKATLSITGTDRDAALLAAIETASEAIENEVGPLAREEIRERFAGYGNADITLSRGPIESLLGVTYCGDPVDGVSISGGRSENLTLPGGWTWTAGVSGLAGDPQPGTETLDFEALVWVGYLVPDQVVTWESGLDVAADSWVRSSRANTLRFYTEEGGTTGGFEPVWPAAGSSVVDGTVSWVAYPARELPRAIQEACLEEVCARVLRVRREVGVTEYEADGARIRYSPSSTTGARLFSHEAEVLLRPYRREWV